MPMHTLEKVINGDETILESYRQAKNKWSELLYNFKWIDKSNLERMTELVQTYETQMEYLVEGADIGKWAGKGKEIMVITGIGQFYSTASGFDKNINKAKLVRDAFLSSRCSEETKYYARIVGELYSL